jgi:TonB family protein
MKRNAWLFFGPAMLVGPLAWAVTPPPSQGRVITEVRVDVGFPASGKAEAEETTIPTGTVILSEGRGDGSSERYMNIRRELKEAYRFTQLVTRAGRTVRLVVGESQAVSNALTGIDVSVTLLASDRDTATYEVRLTEAGKKPLDSRIMVKRDDWAIMGGRDGATAPYFFVLVRPWPLADEAGADEWKGGTRLRVIEQVDTVYPDEARKARLQDVVELELEIRADGFVSLKRVLKGQVPALVEAAKESVLKWRFEPARDATGQPVTSAYVLTTAFKLDEDAKP